MDKGKSDDMMLFYQNSTNTSFQCTPLFMYVHASTSTDSTQRHLCIVELLELLNAETKHVDAG